MKRLLILILFMSLVGSCGFFSAGKEAKTALEVVKKAPFKRPPANTQSEQLLFDVSYWCYKIGVWAAIAGVLTFVAGFKFGGLQRISGYCVLTSVTCWCVVFAVDFWIALQWYIIAALCIWGGFKLWRMHEKSVADENLKVELGTHFEAQDSTKRLSPEAEKIVLDNTYHKQK